jgi:hypothetical protein
MAVPGAGAETIAGEWGLLFSGHRISVLQNAELMEVSACDGCTTL